MSNASEAMTTAINQGKPTVFDKPTSEIGALFEDLIFYEQGRTAQHASQKSDTRLDTYRHAIAAKKEEIKKLEGLAERTF